VLRQSVAKWPRSCKSLAIRAGSRQRGCRSDAPDAEAQVVPTTLSSGSGWLLARYRRCRRLFVQELFLRRPGTASSVNASHDDEGTTRMLLASSGLAYGAAPIPSPITPSAAAATGLIRQARELALRVWSMRTLGSFYTRTLRTTKDQHVVDTGPYRMIRHPGTQVPCWCGSAQRLPHAAPRRPSWSPD
jgi:Isoprenylcysteine carboxyl methyltransferase (ICMT) family